MRTYLHFKKNKMSKIHFFSQESEKEMGGGGLVGKQRVDPVRP